MATCASAYPMTIRCGVQNSSNLKWSIMQVTKLSPKVVEQLGYYVYLYIDPRNDTVFYVGKGKGNRARAHLSDKSDSEKVKVIKQIRARKQKPRIDILIHGLEDEMTALRIEAAVIDLLGKGTLTNQVRGWGSGIVGRMELNDLVTLYESKPVRIDEPVLLIRVNQLYRYGISDEELYDITRGVWKIGARREKAKYAFAVYKGLVRGVYRIDQWSRAGTTEYRTRTFNDVNVHGRWEFTGDAAKHLQHKYVGKSVASYLAENSQNPIKYVNC
jgi:uncharacterized protein